MGGLRVQGQTQPQQNEFISSRIRIGESCSEEGFNVDREVKIGYSIIYVYFIKRVLEKKHTNEND